MSKLKNVRLQVRYSQQSDWESVKLKELELSDNGNVRLAYYTSKNVIEFYEASYDELVKGDGMVRFVGGNLNLDPMSQS